MEPRRILRPHVEVLLGIRHNMNSPPTLLRVCMAEAHRNTKTGGVVPRGDGGCLERTAGRSRLCVRGLGHRLLPRNFSTTAFTNQCWINVL